MIQFVLNRKPLFIIAHVLIGFFATLPVFPSLFGYVIIMLCIGIVILSENKFEEAFLMSSYVAGVEVFLRMIKGAPLFETGKYSIILILFVGMIVGKTKQRMSIAFPIYLLLLLLGIVFTDVPGGESIRRAIAFNLSGPFMLGVAAIYFYKRTITKQELHNALIFFILPIFSMVTFMYFRTPDFSEINFGGVSLGDTSGGFGPNQVATALGFGIFILGYFILVKQSLTGYFIVDAIIMMYFIFRGLLTFSRGGIVTAAICFVLFAFLFILHKRDYSKIFQYLVVGTLFMTSVWVYTADVTGGMLNNRYTGRNARGIKKADASAGRIQLFKSQLQGFQDAPLFGIGVGNGKYRRLEAGGMVGTSHNEVTRLIEEHGLIGLIILILLLLVPILHFLPLNNYQRGILGAFYVFWFLTINHSAMRIAFPGLIYGLALINLRTEDE